MDGFWCPESGETTKILVIHYSYIRCRGMILIEECLKVFTMNMIV